MTATLRLDDFIPYRLSFASNLVSERIARVYQALFGLSIPEWRLVAVAAEAGAIAQAEIVGRTRMDKMTVNRAAAALVARGLIARRAHDGDRRSHLLSLTGAGERLYAAVAPEALALEARIFAGLGAAERDAFLATLRRIEAAALALDGDAGGG